MKCRRALASFIANVEGKIIILTIVIIDYWLTSKTIIFCQYKNKSK